MSGEFAHMSPGRSIQPHTTAQKRPDLKPVFSETTLMIHFPPPSFEPSWAGPASSLSNLSNL